MVSVTGMPPLALTLQKGEYKAKSIRNRKIPKYQTMAMCECELTGGGGGCEIVTVCESVEYIIIMVHW
jgi:hypothetical protein